MKKSFDYSGYTRSKLLKLCEQQSAHSGMAPWRYWTSEVYSFGRHIRSYGNYPSFLPLYCYSDHGVRVCGEPAPHELNNDAPVMLYFSPDMVNFYKKKSDKPCYCIPSPFVWYRRNNKITKSENAIGTIAFPAHSTQDVKVNCDIEVYIQFLQNLPKNYQPVCVCLHMHDIHKGLHEVFLKHGIPVYTAGHAHDKRFAERWYDIVKNFSYATSNMLGSYTPYCVEMGIPFFLSGPEALLYNESDPNLQPGAYEYKNPSYLAVEKLFANPVDEVTPEQQDWAEYHLGVRAGISRWALTKILYSSFWGKGCLFGDLFGVGKNVWRQLRRRIRGRRKNIERCLGNVAKAVKLSIRLRKLRVSPLEVFRLACINRKEPIRTRLFGRTFVTNSAFWHLHGLQELFLDKTYLFNADKDEPRIIDCGANTGLSAIFFKRLCPKSRLTAFEPDPDIFSVLETNLKNFGYDDVEIRQAAVWTENGTLRFLTSGGVGGRIGYDGEGNAVAVPALRLRDFLNEPVDFLKIDIEGAEGEVIKDCAGHLGEVANIFIEYHSSGELPQNLDDILRILKEAGFRYYIKEAWNNQPRPYINKRFNLYDLQLNIFGYRLQSEKLM